MGPLNSFNANTRTHVFTYTLILAKNEFHPPFFALYPSSSFPISFNTYFRKSSPEVKQRNPAPLASARVSALSSRKKENRLVLFPEKGYFTSRMHDGGGQPGVWLGLQGDLQKGRYYRDSEGARYSANFCSYLASLQYN